jgi:NADPH:quinone reductase-like Zn-dependent oxidoreductase
MKAAVRRRYGPPDVVSVVDVETPVAGADELLVKVHATTVNRTDCAARAADPFIWRLLTGLVRPRITVLGNEFAGEVVAVGDAVTSFRVGDRVFGYDDATFGAHAQYLTVKQDAPVAAIPDGLGYDEVAPATEGSHYALAMLRGAKVGAGDDVLVHGATGAIGSAAVQLAKSLGARVTAVCDTANLRLVEGLGADRVVDRTAVDFTEDAQRYDVVVDAVGKSTFGRCRRLLKPRGTYLSSDPGPWWQNPLLALTTPLLRGRRVRFPIPRTDPGMAAYFAELLATGRFTPVIDRRYPLTEIVEAHRYVDSGRKVGNVVITVAHGDP